MPVNTITVSPSERTRLLPDLSGRSTHYVTGSPAHPALKYDAANTPTVLTPDVAEV
jgi:hypothetical protein